jgi:(1->4)-alpha-D-glucan 1-alpha-D-glucosylmutase
VDHPDGLRDPATYFKRLQEAVAEGDDHHRSKGPLYIVAEKILAEGEDLPRDWPVSGTTGYDFANLACGLLLDGETADEVDQVWRSFTRETAARFGDLAVAAKKEVIEHSFGSEMAVLSRKFLTLLPQSLQQPENLPRVKAVLAETIACFPVYRTYPGLEASEEERRVIRQACSEAARRLETGHREDGGETAIREMIGLLEEILTGPTGDVELPPDAPASTRERAQWAVRFQQLSAPVMAKGVEDTALYRWTRLASINDVGADPDVTGVTVAHFHEANAHRRAGWPHAMLATSTHDNKRGEYVRMRINLISEDPSGWRAIATAWQSEAARLMEQDGMARRPSDSDQYLLFQTFIGTWPLFSWRPEAYERSATGGSPPPAEGLEEPLQNYAERLMAYMTKACREAKVETSWTEPDEAYEQAVHRLIDLILEDAALGARIGGEVMPFGWYGALSSLSLTALKLTVPGVPDIYQGANVLDDSLVDPDNRRPVEFSERKKVILELAELAAKPAAEIQSTLSAWVAAGDFPRLKLWTIHRLLNWRALHPQLFESGEYVPVPVKGPLGRHCVAYARRNERHGILVVATRLYRELGFPGPGEVEASAGAAPTANWSEEALDLEAAGIRAVHFNDILSTPVNPADPVDGAGSIAEAIAGAPTRGSLAVAPLLSVLPVAVLSFDIDKSGG